MSEVIYKGMCYIQRFIKRPGTGKSTRRNKDELFPKELYPFGNFFIEHAD